MTKYELAYQLRERMVCRGDISREQAKTLSAMSVITVHCACVDCGAMLVSPEQLKQATFEAHCVEEWLYLIGQAKQANAAAQEQVPLLNPPDKEHSH